MVSAMSEKPFGTNTSTELAKERNREAADRTLMAWIRTALSLIGFGFGIGKLNAYLEASGVHRSLDPIRSTLIFGGLHSQKGDTSDGRSQAEHPGHLGR